MTRAGGLPTILADYLAVYAESYLHYIYRRVLYELSFGKSCGVPYIVIGYR